MRTTLLLTGLLSILLMSCSTATAQVIVSDDFESYADSAALYTVWEPRNGLGTAAPANPDDGVLVDETYIDPFISDPGLQDVGARAFPEPGGGQGVDHIGESVLQYVNLNGGAIVAPTATKNLVLQGDLFDTGALGNKRMSIGLRSRASTENLVEIGFWNTDDIAYAHRAILFGSGSDPNWQFFDLPIELDRDDDSDTIVNPADVGEGWHRYTTTIGLDTITYEIDLFRDGINNGTGGAGPDASVTYNFGPLPSGFDSLRIGAPSGLSSPAEAGVLFDNILLELVDIGGGSVLGDYNGNGTVDAADYTLWRDTLADSVPSGTGADGNDNGVIDPLDYDIWRDNFGNTSSTAASVPEPSTLGLLLATSVIGLLYRKV